MPDDRKTISSIFVYNKPTLLHIHFTESIIMEQNKIQELKQTYLYAGSFSLALRLVVGWTYFSALWRRIVLENKLDENVAGYIGEKFNHFLPNALIIKPMIEFLVTNPDWLWVFMVIFTIVEGIVGFCIMLGLFSRLMSLGVISLAMGILLGSGWLGTTCLDEWQIGVLGIAGGFLLFLTGGGHFSVDNKWLQYTKLGNTKLFALLGSGVLPLKTNTLNRVVVVGSICIFVLTLFTNQYFHGGLWGPLHNKSVKPKIEISDATLSDRGLSFTLFRVEGADVYGSFLIGITLKDKDGNAVLDLHGNDLAKLRADNIKNSYIAKVKTGKHSLVLPLGAKAQLTFDNSNIRNLPQGEYQLILTDISGITWLEKINLK